MWACSQLSRISCEIQKQTSPFYVFALLAEQNRNVVNTQDLSQCQALALLFCPRGGVRLDSGYMTYSGN